MKKELNVAAYESPMSKVVVVEAEGVFCVSNVGVAHEEYSRGADINF